MSQNLEARIRGHQPPLPLVDVSPHDDPTATSDAGTEAEWRLDEHTRMVGRMGIAAARAQLRNGTASAGPGGTDPVRRATGRAA